MDYKNELNEISRAGIIVLKRDGENIKILGLKDEEYFDLPKGHIHKNENVLDCAYRETYEESGLSDIEIIKDFGMLYLKDLILFIGFTNSMPIVKPNPLTNIQEHEYHKWFSLEEKCKNHFKPFLRPAIQWAINCTFLL